MRRSQIASLAFLCISSDNNSMHSLSDWQPSASLKTLRQRAEIFRQIREFFAERDVLEVDTPLLTTTTATDLHIASFIVAPTHFLQTSPEFCMKRLLAANYGAIYQLGKAFRHNEVGRQHNPEFTMLEWYRPGFDHQQLMQEVDELLQTILQTAPAEKFTYAAIFQHYLQLDPHRASLSELTSCVQKNNINLDAVIDPQDRDAWLHLLMTHLIEPRLGKNRPAFIYDFPETQAALARIRPGDPAVAERFEVYIKGVELANGYHELSDAQEQRQRFLQDQQRRAALNYPTVPMDERLLSALTHGFPNCAGVALGFDRLIMLAVNAQSITDVIPFAWDRV